MTKIVLKYVQRFEDRHGRLRFYFRRPGFQRVALPGLPASQEFMAAYQDALDSGTPKTAGEERTKPGTIGALIVAYYQSHDWAQLDPLTHKTYRNMLDRFRERVGNSGVKYGDLPARGVQERHVYKILDAMADTPGAARNLIKRLRTVWDFGRPRGLVAANPFKDVKLPKPGAGFRPWTEGDIERFEDHWPEGSRQRLALYLLLYTLQRRSDVARMGRQHRRVMKFEDPKSGAAREVDCLHFTQVKGGQKKGSEPVELIIPLHPQLKAVLDALPRDNLTFVLTEWGKPFSAAGFTHWFSAAAEAAGLPAGSTPHGLRKAGSRRLAEAGCTPHELQSMTGHKSLAEVERYTRSAEQAKLARSAMGKMDGGRT